jgi:hypothetical protein
MTLKTRLSKLEATASREDTRQWLRVIGDSQEECDAKRCALIDAGQALESDRFVFRIIVTQKEASCAT